MRNFILVLTAAFLFWPQIRKSLSDHVKPQIVVAVNGGMAHSLRANAVPFAGTWTPVAKLKERGFTDYALTDSILADDGNYQRFTETTWPMRRNQASKAVFAYREDAAELKRRGCETVFRAMDGEKEGRIVLAVCGR